jgi:hypothetical protein
MVRWKGYGPEHNKWVKHSDVFAKNTIDAYYCRYSNAPAGSPWLSSTRCPSGGTTGPSASYAGTPYSKGGVMSGEPLLQTLFCLTLRILLRLSICSSNHPGHLSALAGTCCAIRPVITADTSRHVLLGSYQLVYKVSPSMGIPILSSFRIPLLRV